jgi:hypothetical protein
MVMQPCAMEWKADISVGSETYEYTPLGKAMQRLSGLPLFSACWVM